MWGRPFQNRKDPLPDRKNFPTNGKWPLSDLKNKKKGRQLLIFENGERNGERGSFLFRRGTERRTERSCYQSTRTERNENEVHKSGTIHIEKLRANTSPSPAVAFSVRSSSMIFEEIRKYLMIHNSAYFSLSCIRKFIQSSIRICKNYIWLLCQNSSP